MTEIQYFQNSIAELRYSPCYQEIQTAPKLMKAITFTFEQFRKETRPKNRQWILQRLMILKKGLESIEGILSNAELEEYDYAEQEISQFLLDLELNKEFPLKNL